ncbi:MAG: SelT/SelW/SelH family protein [Dehalococcoidia bacterium]|nr:SelT/SelW/SelH family protein [Dehalococcoidia bacterium]
MTEKILKEFHRTVGKASLVPGDRGAFEVSINGAVVFSKLKEGRFPSIGELRAAVRAATQG